MGTSGRNKLTHPSGIEMVRAAEAHENKHDLNNTDCVTGGEVGSGRVRRGRRKRAAGRCAERRACLLHDGAPQSQDHRGGGCGLPAKRGQRRGIMLPRGRRAGSALRSRSYSSWLRGRAARRSSSARRSARCGKFHKERTSVPIYTTYSDIVISETYA